jgi:hypothetical protein
MDEHSSKDPAMALRARSLPWEKPLPDRFAGHEHVRLQRSGRPSLASASIIAWCCYIHVQELEYMNPCSPESMKKKLNSLPEANSRPRAWSLSILFLQKVLKNTYKPNSLPETWSLRLHPMISRCGLVRRPGEAGGISWPRGA